MTEEPINWELLSHATGGSTRGVLGESGPDEAHRLLADLECLSAEERLERLAADIQTILDSDPDFTTEKKTGSGSMLGVQFTPQGDELRRMSRGNDRGRHGGILRVPEMRIDTTNPRVSPGLEGMLFFETVFAKDVCLR